MRRLQALQHLTLSFYCNTGYQQGLLPYRISWDDCIQFLRIISEDSPPVRKLSLQYFFEGVDIIYDILQKNLRDIFEDKDISEDNLEDTFEDNLGDNLEDTFEDNFEDYFEDWRGLEEIFGDNLLNLYEDDISVNTLDDVLAQELVPKLIKFKEINFTNCLLYTSDAADE